MPKAKAKDGLPKVGDRVYCRVDEKSSWEHGWKVTKVEDRGFLMVEMTKRGGKKRKMGAGDHTYFAPPAKELPKELRELRKRGYTDIVRNLDKGRFKTRSVYDVLCTKCMSVYSIREGYIEAADFFFDGDCFRSGKPEIVCWAAPLPAPLKCWKSLDIPLGIICECTFPEDLDVEYESYT
jgi:hypothetical protein